MCRLLHLLSLSGLFFFTSFSVQAEELSTPEFRIPLECEVPSECVVQNYMDVRPGPGVRDFNCGTLSYERHKGTDFRVLDYASYERGVPVLAAADGTVLRLRDGEVEGDYLRQGKEAVKAIEGGNGVVVQHKGGWQTLYAHLKRGSIKVSVGDKVKAGDSLGVVGLSGKTEFTHLHFQVIHNNKIYDPYIGTIAAGCQNRLKKSFWNDSDLKKLKYIGTGLVEANFSSEIPVYKQLPFSDERKRISLRKDAEVLIYWMEAWGVKTADRLTMTYTDPSGKVSTDQKILKKNQASYFKYLGKRKGITGWMKGKYKGQVILERIIEGRWEVVFSKNSEITMH
ncbi:M23 family metallopeptidase [Kiloniella sp.]|uniref:M23 family metallopeptidase n=1 Tax=Kiloniella sp. TaxID=1938587 RepID=UPI003B01C904